MPSGTIYEKLGSGQNAFSVATRVSDWEIERPLWPLDASHMVISARYQQKRASYAPLQTNQQLGENPAANAVFVGDSPLRDLRGGLCEFTRTYATVPAGYNDFESYSVRYPGFDSTAVVARDAFTRVVTSRLSYAYYLIGPGGSFGSPDDIPITECNMPELDALTDGTDPNALGWIDLINADASNNSRYSIVIEDTVLDRYLGNIWRAVTRHVKAR